MNACSTRWIYPQSSIEKLVEAALAYHHAPEPLFTSEIKTISSSERFKLAKQKEKQPVQDKNHDSSNAYQVQGPRYIDRFLDRINYVL